MAVVGFDDIAMAAHVHPSLTTVRQDVARGAKLLVDLVLRRLDGEDTPSAIMPGGARRARVERGGEITTSGASEQRGRQRRSVATAQCAAA